MTNREFQRREMMNTNLRRMGFSSDECNTLRRISMTLHSWNERLCNDCEVDEHDKAFQYNPMNGRRWPIANRGKGAEKRLAVLMAKYPHLIAYQQGDPRGCAVYIIEKSRLKERGIQESQVDAYYSSVGVAVY